MDFCEGLKALGEFVARPPDTPGVAVTDLDRREGVRYLTRVLRGGERTRWQCLLWGVGCTDAARAAWEGVP